MKRRGRGSYDVDKPPVFTIVHRETKYTIFLVLKNLKKVVDGIVDRFVEKEAVLYTDEYVIYNNLINHEKVTNHYTINYGQREYIKGEIHVNNNENRHSLLRRFLRIFRGVSKKNLQGYILLEQFRINYKTDSYDMILETIIE